MVIPSNSDLQMKLPTVNETVGKEVLVWRFDAAPQSDEEECIRVDLVADYNNLLQILEESTVMSLRNQCVCMDLTTITTSYLWF